MAAPLNTGPLNTGTKTVPAEWIDYNGHMMDGYYPLAFSAATEALLERLGVGEAYRVSTGAGMYTVESHVCYRRSVLAGTVLRFGTLLLGCDAKRLHVFHEMSDAADGPVVGGPVVGGPVVGGTVVATNELMLLHVRGERVVPMPRQRLDTASELAAAHARLPVPSGAGSRIGMR